METMAVSLTQVEVLIQVVEPEALMALLPEAVLLLWDQLEVMM
jgi:hypothetical protein